jgi:hypothetical protein
MVTAPTPPNSSNAHLPEQIRRQLAEAEGIRAELDGAPGEDEQPPEGQPPEGQPPQQQPPMQPEPSGDDQTWEQRFRSQQGRLEATLDANRALNERLNHLDTLLSTMEARGAQPPGKEPPPPAQRPQLVTDQERTDFGDELLTVVGKRAREELFPEFNELKASLLRLEGQVKGVGKVIEKDQKNDVYATLDNRIQDWRAINNSQEFKAWLARPDLMSGRQRFDLLKEAFTRHEANRVLAFFEGFITEVTGSPPTSSSPGNAAPPLPGNGNGSGKPSLEDFAAPGKARSAPAGQLPPEKPVYTTAQIAQFYADRRTGKWRGREAEADTIERDIFQAQHEGRIQ